MRYSINKEAVMFTQMGDEGVMMDLNTNEYLSLNETYFRIISCIEEGRSVEEIVEVLLEEFEVSREVCEAEVQRVIDDLLAKKYLV
jgi:hypothetical protein